MPKWLKTILKILGALVAFVLVVLIAISLYITTHKKKVLAMVTATLNKNLDGTLTIGSMDPAFFSRFPNISLKLNDVTLKDKQWARHHHTFLTAKVLSVSVNAAALLRGTVQVNKIGIDNAAIDLFTDSTGYSNTSVFKKKANSKKQEKKDDSESSTEIKQFDLNQVSFTLDNQQASKLFQFAINSLSGNMDYPDSGWKADFDLDVLAKSMAFNTKKGSFIKDKRLAGPFNVSYDDNKKIITVAPNKLNIGDDPFTIGAQFNLGSPNTDFTINIATEQLLWRHASSLLAANISKKLNQFDLKNPIAVKCLLKGAFSGGGDPLIFVTCHVEKNVLQALGGEFTECSFNGVFTNNYMKGMGLSDENSAIKILDLNAKYKELPINIDSAIIHNLSNPVAEGTVRSKFDVRNMNNILGTQTLRFDKGDASLKLDVKANIVDFKLYKPLISGQINVVHADASYVPRNLNFKNTGISVVFSGNDLLLNKIRLQTGRSIVLMQAQVKNFLNLYYSAPEQILISWQITSPQLYLAEFLGFLNTRRKSVPVKHTNTKAASMANTGSFIDQFNDVFEKSRAEMHMRIANLHYKKFLATDAHADITVEAEGITLKTLTSNQAGGTLSASGRIIQGETTNNRFALNTVVSNVNVRNFFYAFDNFGMKDLTYNNLKGLLSAKANITGIVTNEGELGKNSVNGTVNINLRNGALINYGPLKTIDKYVPFRDLSNITLNDLNGHFDLHGEKITIQPMQVNSSVLNMNVSGIYSLGRGTNISMDVPLRNPEKDKDITDKQELQKRRMKGIVLHLAAVDNDNGGVKIKLR
ncbi:hypothetical protein GCM10027037_30790 [Mucilaginibacter koreensis]